jgi:outer membrane protein assembly factor BamB
VLIARASGQGELATVNEENGLKVEDPFPTFPTEHAPVAIGATLVLVSTIGKVVAYNLGGTTLFTKPDGSMLLETSPLEVAPDGSLRIATTSGRVLGFAGSDGAQLFDAPIGGTVISAPRTAANGTTYVATDEGRLVGVDASGGMTLDVPLTRPASGPSVDNDTGHVAVGEGDAVRVVDREGHEVFKHTRAARVVGTRWISTNELLAWGEDGIVERLDANGGTISTFNAGHPIYADVVPLSAGSIAVFDSTGIAHRVNKDGVEEGTLDLGSAPATEIVRGTGIGFVFVAVGNAVMALDFELK